MNTFQNTLALSVVSRGIWDAFDLIGFDDQKVTAADAPVKGVALSPSTELGLDIAVIAIGTARVKAAGTIAAGSPVVSAADGGVAAGSASANAFATALTDAAAGELVEILIR